MNEEQQSIWQQVSPEILELENLAAQPHQSPTGAYWATMRLLNHIFAANSCYDSATGQSTSQSLRQALKKLSECIKNWKGHLLPEDSLYRTVEFCLEPLERILQTPRKKLLRQHEIMPLYKIREMDSQCMAYLAKQPGRNAREKIAIKERALGVQREISANTLENQIVRRFLLEIKPLLTQRINLANYYEKSEVNQEKLKVLERLNNLCTDSLRNSWLNQVTPSTILKTNNVLLSDRLYNKVWRSVQWFHKHRTEIVQIWNSGPLRMSITTFWLLLAKLWTKTTPIFDDALCLLHPGFVQESFGITTLQSDSNIPDWQNWNSPYLELLVPWDYNCYFLRITCQDGKILIETNRMEYSNRPGVEVWEYGKREPVQYIIQISLKPEEYKEENRYCPCQYSVFRNSKEIMLSFDFADLTGMNKFTNEFWDLIFRVQRHSDFYRWEENYNEIEISHSNLVGLDLSGAHPRLFSDDKFAMPKLYTYAIPFELPDKTIDWQVGHQTPLLPNAQHLSKMISFSSIFEEQDSNSDENLWIAGLQRIANNLSKNISLSPHVQLAVAIPDTLDELAFQLARSTLTPICDKLYFLWRSVAGALGWQQSYDFQTTQIQSGDVVLVMDAEAPIWTTTCLVARYDRRLENTPFCGIYWERKPPLLPIAEGENLNYTGLLADYLRQTFRAQGLFSENNNNFNNEGEFEPRDFPIPANMEIEDIEEKLEEIISNLIATGLAERLVETELPIWIALPHSIASFFHNPESMEESDSVWIKIYFDREIWKQATQVWYVRFKDWLYNWKFSDQLQEIRQYAGNRDIHFLCIGRPFHKKWLRETIQYYLGNHFDAVSCRHHILESSQEIVAQGARSFLERVSDNLPTYEDWLPDLYLQVLDNGIPNYIQIFEGRTARPGQEIFYNVPNTLELPPNQLSYRIPLVRDRNSRRPLLYAARLESPSFPLRQPITVTMQVWYRYGEDSYRLIVKPQNIRNTTFKEIEVKWVRGAEHHRDSRQNSNLAPNFPPKEPWDKYELEQYSQWFLEAATDLQREAKQIFNISFFRYHRIEYVARYLENFSRLLEKKLLPPCKRLLHYNKSYESIPTEVISALREKVVPWLIRLAGLESNNLQEVLEELSFPNIVGTLQRIQQVSLEVLSLLGPETPKIFLDYLLQKFSDPTKDREVCYMFGRVIGAGKEEREELVITILEELKHRFEDNNHYSNDDRPKNKVGYRYLLWAIATALWRHPDFIYTLREHNFIRFLLKIIQHDCHSLLYTLQKASLTPKYQINYLSYFRSIAEILLGLLRLRGDEDSHFLQAGSRRMTELAFFLHQIDALFLKSGYECKSCFKFECVQKHEGMSEIIHVVTSYLSGEEYSGLIKIKKIEENPENDDY